ncbi:sensor histidine kinase [Anaerosalibacter massiliensis]|uniref:sensor histidine kinase n=1 Tax=Anaerosalibacter massiliensis TaxID=1347392 RepID=UPI0005B28F08|nr:sensor histidine kinase [Anaerosalibacter massiliensis]
MNKHLKFYYYISKAIYVFIFIDILNRTSNNIISSILFVGMFIAIIINDHLRIYGFYTYKYGCYISILISAIMSSIIAYFVEGNIDIYMFMVLYEIILYIGGRIGKTFFIVDILLILGVIILRQASFFKELCNTSFWRENLLNLIMISLFIALYSFALYAYKALYVEKTKVEKLNKYLEQQSKQIERLTITKERNRVAQETHDYLGHNLSALNMNLDVAGKIIRQDPEKTRKIINKCQNLTKESMNGLRKAVYSLKEDNRLLGLKDSIEKLMQNINSTGNVNFFFNFAQEVEELSLDYKNIIYSIIREGLTNSIKHGQANKIYINIEINEGNIDIVFKDNGSGCSKIIRGNGLKGIEERIFKTGGIVDYKTEEGKGFEIEGKIPIVAR